MTPGVLPEFTMHADPIFVLQIFKHYLKDGTAARMEPTSLSKEKGQASLMEVAGVAREDQPGGAPSKDQPIRDREESLKREGKKSQTEVCDQKLMQGIQESLQAAQKEVEDKSKLVNELISAIQALRGDFLVRRNKSEALSREIEKQSQEDLKDKLGEAKQGEQTTKISPDEGNQATSGGQSSRRSLDQDSRSEQGLKDVELDSEQRKKLLENHVEEGSDPLVELDELKRSWLIVVRQYEDIIETLQLHIQRLLDELSNQKLSTESELNKLELALKQVNENVKEANRSIQEKDDRIRKLDGEILDRESSLEGERSQAKAAQTEIEKLKSAVKDEAEKGILIETTSNDKLKTLEEQMGLLLKELDTKKNHLLGLEKAKSQLEEELEGERSPRSRLEKRVKELEDALGKNSSLEELIQRHRKEEAETLEKIKELKEKAKRRKDELVEEKKKREEIDARNRLLEAKVEKDLPMALGQLEEQRDLTRKLQMKISELEMLLKSQQSEFDRSRKEADNLQEDSQKLLRIQAEEGQKVQGESGSLKRELLEANEQIKKLMQGLKEAKDQESKQRNLIDDLTNQLKTISIDRQAKEKELVEQLKTLSDTTANLKEELRGVSEAKIDLEERLKRLSQEKENREKEWTEQKNGYEREKTMLSASQADLLKNSSQESKSLEEAKGQLERCSQALKEMTQDRDEARKSLMKCNEQLGQLQRSLENERKDKTDRLEKQSEELKGLNDKLKGMKEKISKLEKTIENQRKELDRAKSDQMNVFALKEDESSKLMASYMQLRELNNGMITELEGTKKEREKCEKELKERSQECIEMRDRVEIKSGESKALKARVEVLEGELKARDDRIRELGQELKNKMVELEKMVEGSKGIQDQLRSHEQEENKLREELKLRLEGNRKLKEELEAERKELEARRIESTDLQSRNSKLVEDIGKKGEEFGLTSNKLKELQQHYKDLQQKLQGMQGELSVSNQKLADLEKNYQAAKDEILKHNERDSEAKKTLDNSIRQGEDTEFKLRKEVSALALKVKESEEAQKSIEAEIAKQRDLYAEEIKRREKQESDRTDRLTQQHAKAVKDLENTISQRDNEIKQLKLMASNSRSEASLLNFMSPGIDLTSKVDPEMAVNDWNGSELSSSVIEESPLRKKELRNSVMEFTSEKKRGSWMSNQNGEMTSLRKARVVVYAVEHLIRNLKAKALHKIFASKIIRDRNIGEAGLRIRGRLLLVLRSRYAQVGVRRSLLKWRMISNPNFLRDCVTKIALISKLTNQTVFWRFRKLIEKKIPKDSFPNKKKSAAAEGSFMLAKLFAEKSKNCIIQTFNIMRPEIVGKKYKLLIKILDRNKTGQDARKLKALTNLKRFREMSKRIVELMIRSLVRKSLLAFEILKRNSDSHFNRHSEKLFASEVFSTIAILKGKIDKRIRQVLKLERLQQLPGKIELIKKQIMSNLRENQKWTLKQLLKHSAKNSSKEYKKNLLQRNLINALRSACSSKVQQAFENLLQNKFGLKTEEKIEHARQDKETVQMLLKKRKGLQRLLLACAAKLRLAYQLLIKNKVSNAGREQILLSDDKRRKAMIGRMMIRLLSGFDTLKLHCFNKLVKHSVLLQNTGQLHTLNRQQILAKLINFQEIKKARCFELLFAFYRQSLNLQQKKHSLLKKVVERSMIKLHWALKRLMDNRDSKVNVKTIEGIRAKNYLTLLANRVTKSREVAYLKMLLFSAQKVKANQRMQFLLSKLIGSLTQKIKVAMHKLGFVNLKMHAIEKLNETSLEIEADIRLNMTRKALKRLIIACKGKSLSSVKRLKLNRAQIDDETKRREQAVNNIVERLNRSRRDTLGICSLRLKKHASGLRDKEKRERRGKSLIINRLILALNNAVSSAYTQLQLNSCERESRTNECLNKKKLIIQMLRRAQQTKVMTGMHGLRNYAEYVEGCNHRANQLRRKLFRVLVQAQSSKGSIALSKLVDQNEAGLGREKQRNQFSCHLASLFHRKSKLLLQNAYFVISLHCNKLIGEQNSMKRAGWVLTRCVQKGAANKLEASYSKLKAWLLFEKSRREQEGAVKRGLLRKLFSAQRCKLLIAKDRLKEAAVQNHRILDSKVVRQKESLTRLLLASRGKESQAVGSLLKNASSQRASEMKKKIVFSGLEKRASISSLSTIYKLKLNGIVKSFKDELRLSLFSKLLNQVHRRFLARQIERLAWPHRARQLFRRTVRKAEMRLQLAAGGYLERWRQIVEWRKRFQMNQVVSAMLNNIHRNWTVVFRMVLRKWLRNSMELKNSKEALLRTLARLALRRIGSGFEKIRGMSKLKGLEYRNNGYRLLMTLLEGMAARRKRDTVHRLKQRFHSENRWYKVSVDILTQRTFINSQIAMWRIKDAKDLGLCGVPTNVTVKLRRVVHILERRRTRLEQTAFNAINYSASGQSRLTSSALSMKSHSLVSSFIP
jgi:chromosome segregation ATPase